MGYKTIYFENSPSSFFIIICILILVIKIFSTYKRCPKNCILVIYRHKQIYRCLKGKGAFIIPFFENYHYLNLTPVEVAIDVSEVYQERQNPLEIFVCKFAISNEPEYMSIAAKNYVGMHFQQIQQKAKDHFIACLKKKFTDSNFQTITMDKQFLDEARKLADETLRLHGLRLLSVYLNEKHI